MAVLKSLKWRKERGAWFDDVIRRAEETDRDVLLDKVFEYREMYFREPGGFDSTEADGPWENSANLHIPMITEKVETATPKVMSAMWRASPFVNVRRPGGSDFNAEKARNIENFLSWAFRNDIPNFYITFENFIRNMLIDGTSFAKIRWERKMRRAVETHFVAAFDGDAPEGVQVDRSVVSILKEVFGLGDVRQTMHKWEPVAGEDSTYIVQFTEGAREFSARVEIYTTDMFDKLRVRVFRNIVERESPMIDLVELEDLVFPFRSPNLQDADWVAHRTWYTYREIEGLVKAGNWSLTKKQLGTLKGNRRHADDTNDHETMKDDIIGLDGQTGQHLPTPDMDIDPNKILVWEIYVEDYVDSESEPINVVHFMPEHVRCIASTEYHDEVFAHGKRPFVSATYIPVAGRVYGIGMAELLYGVNMSVDHTINMVHNNMVISTTPAGFYSPMTLGHNNNALKIKPGEMIPVMNPRDVYFPSFGQQPLAMYHATFDQMKGIADSLTFSPTAGGSTNFRNAPRTARGTLAMMDAAEERLSAIVEQMQATPWKEMIEQTASLYGSHMTIEKWYHNTGETEAKHITPKELRENFIFEFSGSLTSVNRDVQRTLVQQLYMTLRDEQAYANDPQAANELRRVFANAFGENVDVDKILPDPTGDASASHPPWTQEEENRSIAQGEFVAVLASDDDMAHLKELERFKNTAVYETLPDPVKALFFSHEQAHAAALKQKMAQQQRTADTQGTGASVGSATGPIAPEGAASEGQPSFGGELSGLGGVS
jgi:hypothetical protein